MEGLAEGEEQGPERPDGIDEEGTRHPAMPRAQEVALADPDRADQERGRIMDSGTGLAERPFTRRQACVRTWSSEATFPIWSFPITAGSR